MASIYGSDISTFRGGVVGLDPMWTVIEGERAVIEASARRLMTPQGSLPHAPDAGLDLTQKIGTRLTPVTVARLRADIRAELLKDERVLEVTVGDLTQTAAFSWSVRISLTLATGTFSLVFKVTPESVTADILSVLRGARS
jgi:hypothetical protein